MTFVRYLPQFKRFYFIYTPFYLVLCVVLRLLEKYAGILIVCLVGFGAIMLSFTVLFHLVKRIPGLFSDKICLSETGISLLRGQTVLRSFDWSTVVKVFPSSFPEGKNSTIVVINDLGQSIWFYRSKKAQAYMERVYPPSKMMLSGAPVRFTHKYEAYRETV